MKNLRISRIHSSWNSDRIGSCVVSKTRKERAGRKPYLYARYRDHEVSVCGARDKVRFTLGFDGKVESAVVREDRLIVTTADGRIRHYDVVTGKLVSDICPKPVEGDREVVVISLAA